MTSLFVNERLNEAMGVDKAKKKWEKFFLMLAAKARPSR